METVYKVITEADTRGLQAAEQAQKRLEEQVKQTTAALHAESKAQQEAGSGSGGGDGKTGLKDLGLGGDLENKINAGLAKIKQLKGGADEAGASVSSLAKINLPELGAGLAAAGAAIAAYSALWDRALEKDKELRDSWGALKAALSDLSEGGMDTLIGKTGWLAKGMDYLTQAMGGSSAATREAVSDVKTFADAQDAAAKKADSLTEALKRQALEHAVLKAAQANDDAAAKGELDKLGRDLQEAIKGVGGTDSAASKRGGGGGGGSRGAGGGGRGTGGSGAGAAAGDNTPAGDAPTAEEEARARRDEVLQRIKEERAKEEEQSGLRDALRETQQAQRDAERNSLGDGLAELDAQGDTALSKLQQLRKQRSDALEAIKNGKTPAKGYDAEDNAKQQAEALATLEQWQAKKKKAEQEARGRNEEIDRQEEDSLNKQRQEDEAAQAREEARIKAEEDARRAYREASTEPAPDATTPAPEDAPNNSPQGTPATTKQDKPATAKPGTGSSLASDVQAPVTSDKAEGTLEAILRELQGMRGDLQNLPRGGGDTDASTARAIGGAAAASAMIAQRQQRLVEAIAATSRAGMDSHRQFTLGERLRRQATRGTA